MLFKGPLLHKVWDLVVFLCPIGQYWFGWFAFFMPFQILLPCLDFSPPVCYFLNAVFLLFFFIFQKSHVLARHFYLWWVSDELKVWTFTQSEVLLEGGRIKVTSVRAVDLMKYDFCWVLCEVSCMGFVWSTVKTATHTPQFTNKPDLPLPPALSVISSVFLFTPSSFDCYFQLAESTFSTCAIQRYFSTSLYNFWCTFFYMCYISLMVNGLISWICKHI